MRSHRSDYQHALITIGVSSLGASETHHRVKFSKAPDLAKLPVDEDMDDCAWTPSKSSNRTCPNARGPGCGGIHCTTRMYGCGCWITISETMRVSAPVPSSQTADPLFPLNPFQQFAQPHRCFGELERGHGLILAHILVQDRGSGDG